MRITIFTSSLAAGGAERTVAVLATVFAARGHDVTVITWNAFESDFYRLPDTVRRLRVPLNENLKSVKWYDVLGNLRRFLVIRRTIQRTAPDVGISVLDGSNELFLSSTLGMKFTKLISSQNNLSRRGHYNKRWDILRRFVYRLADSVVLPDVDSAEQTQQQYPGWRCGSIPNALTGIDTTPDDRAASIIRTMARFPLTIVAMGRLVRQKGFDLLLHAFQSVSEQVEGVGLVILGEGPLRHELEVQCRNLKLEDRVFFPGTVEKPHSVIAQCSLFVFSSRYEGQGMALAEAMACGVAVVSFDCPYGPRAMIEPIEGGVLVPPEDVNALSSTIVELLKDNKGRKMYGSNARQISEQLSSERIAGQWEQLIESCR